MHSTIFEPGARSNMKERDVAQAKCLGSYLLISSLLVFSGSLPIFFKIDIISSVWKFRLLLDVKICSNKSFYYMN